ncbi:40-residue YVTN family beta-propeller repeat-containing protein [Amycolatopsis xylanica]|uniref:40-residue YVTN family beta-propeller repeat-containing protein n=1 Tax=Amycolatopsis xylanica TaxID=589385 RepID=A0A1H3H0S9_9PSEU|nr:YncE family protein [Amycolatopsis xylanica]SDY08815.1 40-residue YVTN family beta-propeller repeat-containing protein [Amycolatopsis xylanica]
MTTLAIACQRDATLVFLDTETGERLETLDIAPEPHEACFDAERGLIYVSHTYKSGWYFQNSGRASLISVIDAETRKVIDVIDIAPDHGPHDLQWDAATDNLYVAVESGEGRTGAILMIDPATRKILDRIPVDAHGPHWFAITPDSAKLYTANKETPFVSVVDLVGGTMTARVEVPSTEGIAALDDRVIVAGPVFSGADRTEANGLFVIDTAKDVVTRFVETEEPVTAVHATASGRLLVSEVPASAGPEGLVMRDGMLRIYDSGSLELLKRLPIGAGALSIRSTADGALAFVANSGSGTVTVIDVNGLSVLNTFAADGGAHGMAVVA